MINVDLRKYGEDEEYRQFINGYISGADIDETPMECQLARSVKEATDEEIQEILGKKEKIMDKYKNLTVKGPISPIHVPTEFEDIPHQYCSNIVQHITTASEEEDAFIFEHISSYVNGVMQHEGVTKIPKRLLERALICFNEEHKEEWDVLMGIEENKDKAFHCGFEESGGHAYNCNDCPNKCEEWYQWEKEFKEDKND